LEGEGGHTYLVVRSGAVLAPQHCWPAAVDDHLDGLVDVRLFDKTLEYGFAGERQVLEDGGIPDGQSGKKGVWVAVADS
jgi:hypothetical protein